MSSFLLEHNLQLGSQAEHLHPQGPRRPLLARARPDLSHARRFGLPLGLLNRLQPDH